MKTIRRLLLPSFLWIASVANAETFTFDSFTPTDPIAYRGDAVLSEGRIRLTTPDPGHQSGSAWIDRKLNLGIGFDLTFSFTTGGGNACCGDPNGADGFAFVIHNDPRGLSSIGDSGGNLGFSDIHSALVVEFDSFQNNSGAAVFGDPSGNHVAVLSNGVRLASSSHLESILSSDIWVSPFSFEDLTTHVARIHYTPGRLDIYVGESVLPAAPVLSVPTDLATIDGSGILDPVSGAYVGFTAATGGATNFHYIDDFSLTTTDAFPASEPVAAEIGAAICIEWDSEIDARYQVIRSTDLISWTPIGKVFSGTGHKMQYFEKVESEGTFYRVVRDIPE